MGQIIEGTIPTLFGGVSRQPPQVRQPNQLEEVTNGLSSVVTGGVEKRPNTQTIADLASFLDTTVEYKVHGIDRSATEQDFILIDGTTPAIFAVNAITGAQKTVTIGDTKRYFEVELTDIDQTGVPPTATTTQCAFATGETTFDWGYQLSDAATVFKVQGSIDGVTWNDIATAKTGASGTFSTTIGAAATGDHNYIRVNITTAAGTAADTITLWATFQDMTYILNANPEDLRLTSVADYTFVVNQNYITGMAEADSGTITATYQDFAALEAVVSPTGTGNIYKIVGNDTDGFSTYYVKDNATNEFIEVVDPTAHNNIDGSTMPHQIVRSSDGTSYTFKAATWDARPAGNETLNPQPEFIGRAVRDVVFYRNRLGLISDETVTLSQAGDVFNFFAAKATEVLDSDPIGRAAGTTEVNILHFASVFRKILFATSSRAQFELTSQTALTPDSAEMDQATTYSASVIAKPANMGDVLYFGSKAEASAVVFEYFFQDTTLSNTAADISRHIRTYLANDLFQMDADSTAQTLFVLSTGFQNGLYIYRTFFDGNNKVQSAWGKYTFGAAEANAFIHGFKVFSNYVVMIIERDDGGIYVEQFPIEREALATSMPFMPLLDQREEITGSYNSTHAVTRWISSWEHNDDAQVVLGGSGAIPGRQLNVSYPDCYELTLASVAAGETLVIGGKTFTAHATTTTTANREFSISGTDTQDGDELITCLNDSTDGIGADYIATNASGVVTVRPLDGVDNSAMAAPTGTAITNATITAVLVNDMVAAREDHSAAAAYVGRDYTFTAELSKIYARERDNVPIVTGDLRIRDITILYEDTAYFNLRITPDARSAENYYFEGKELGDSMLVVDSAPVRSSGFFGHKKVMAQADTVKIEIINDKPLPCVITSAVWRGFFNEVGRSG